MPYQKVTLNMRFRLLWRTSSSILLHSMPLGHLGFYVGWVWSGKLHWVGVFFVEKSYSRCTAATEEGVLWGGASGLHSSLFFAYGYFNSFFCFIPESFIPVRKNIRKKQWILLGIQWMLVIVNVTAPHWSHSLAEELPRTSGIGAVHELVTSKKGIQSQGSFWTPALAVGPAV